MTNTILIRLPTHSWRRFWCRPQDRYDLGDAGFLFDPESELGKHLQPHAVALSQLEDKPCLALLGEPGMGKSTTIAQERERLTSSGLLAAGIDLRRDSSAAAIREAIDATTNVESWCAGGGTLTLILDGLDEGISRNPNLAEEIVELLATFPADRLRLQVSCRTLEWPVGLEQRLGAIWGPGAAQRYELLPLRRKDVAIAAADYKVDVNAFLGQVVTRDAQPLATRPVSLRFLLQTFSLDGQLPASKLRLYDDGCRLLCSDEGSWDRARPTSDAFRRMAIAARIAAAGTFTNRQAISRQESAPADALRIQDIVGGTETVHGSTYRVDQDAVDDALEGAALFSLRSSDTFGWTHQSYREFLAAWFLDHRNLPVAELQELYAPALGTVSAASA